MFDGTHVCLTDRFAVLRESFSRLFRQVQRQIRPQPIHELTSERDTGLPVLRVHRLQKDAAHAFGFTGLKLFRRIILPQVLIAVGPVIGNQLIQLIKDSAFLSIITVPELTFAANAVQSYYFVPFESFLFATLLYWALCGGVEWLVRRGEEYASIVRPARD